MASPPSDSSPATMAAEDLATQLAALQAELVAIKAESTAKVASLEETIGNLAHENALLKRRLYGNKTERSRTSELQLALGELLAGETQLQGELDAAVGKAKDAIEPEPKPAPGPRATPKVAATSASASCRASWSRSSTKSAKRTGAGGSGSRTASS
ncbi:MAG TPA: transposase [Kofleriaceae bacterium]